jgi:hypothetical protein
LRRQAPFREWNRHHRSLKNTYRLPPGVWAAHYRRGPFFILVTCFEQ